MRPHKRPVKPARSLARRPAAFPVPGKGRREEAERLVQSILLRRRRIAEEFYAMGLELRELSRPEIYKVLGHASFGELLEKRKIVNRMTALRLISVVEALPIGAAIKLGLEKAYALVRYVEATPAADVAKDIFMRDALVGGKPISEATVREIVEATKQVRGERPRDSRDPDAKEARGAARVLQRALRKAGAKGVTARGAWERGAWWVRVEMRAEEARVVVDIL